MRFGTAISDIFDRMNGVRGQKFGAVLPVDLPAITSPSLADITTLGLQVVAGGLYELEWVLYYTASVGAVNNLQWGLNAPASDYGVLDMQAPKSTTTVQFNTGALSSTGSFTQATAATIFPVKLKAIAHFTAAGIVYPRLSAGSGGSTLVVKAGSRSKSMRIS